MHIIDEAAKLKQALCRISKCSEIAKEQLAVLKRVGVSAIVEFHENFGDSYNEITVFDKNDTAICIVEEYIDRDHIEAVHLEM